MKKKIVSLALVASLLALVIVGGTLAYFTDDEDVTNTFTVGNVDIVLDEGAWVDVSKVAPGVNYDKEPVVYNVGVNDAWIRVDVTLSDYAAFNAAAGAQDPAITDLWSMFKGLDAEKWTRINPDVIDADTITFKFYYKTALAAGTNTGALFTDFVIPGAFDNNEMAAIGEDFTVKVVAHAIQKDTFNTVEDAFAQYIQQDAADDQILLNP